MQRRQRPEAGTYMGRGKLEELKAMCDEVDLLTERIRDLAKDLDAMEAQYCDLQAQV